MEAKNEITHILTLLEETFSGTRAWHGPTVMEVLTSISSETAKKRLSKNTHSIAELVVHMEAWRNFVIQKLRHVEFEMTDELNFPKPGPWAKCLSKLKLSQSKLIDALHAFPKDNLYKKVPGRKYDFHTLLYGIIQHDIYHTGQISLIKKSVIGH